MFTMRLSKLAGLAAVVGLAMAAAGCASHDGDGVAVPAAYADRPWVYDDYPYGYGRFRDGDHFRDGDRDDHSHDGHDGGHDDGHGGERDGAARGGAERGGGEGGEGGHMEGGGGHGGGGGGHR